MLKSKIILVILGLLLSFVTMGADNSITKENGQVILVGSTQMARVIGQKAIVYSDENMLSPIGYIAKGKAVRVGTPRRMNVELVPIIISGRMAFLEIKDIQYDNQLDEDGTKRKAPREHDFDINLEKAPERLDKNNSFYLSLHRYGAGNEVKEAFVNVEGASEDSFTGFQLQFIHRPEGTKFFWGAGFDYSSISSPDMSFSYWMISPTMGMTPFKNQVVAFDIYASLDIGTSIVYEVKNNYESEPTAYVWGVQANTRAVFFPDSKYHGFIGLGLRKYGVSGLENLKDLSENPIPGIRDIFGISTFIGFGMEFR